MKRGQWQRPTRDNLNHMFLDGDLVSMCGRWMVAHADKPDPAVDNCTRCERALETARKTEGTFEG